ncbi:MAG TPA: AbrB/MazE/SpoVT family DNA-binding domain-containing protein [Actinomycetota bacterium]|nr:AbrB/MazE/SpoVT family DNA-binding domain-containing protein [Actinomycetota bacterium]
MRTTIDAAGRVVVPKPLRDELGLAPGQEIEVSVRDGRIELEPVPTPMRLVRRDGVPRAEPEVPVPPLTTVEVREALERVRR